MASTDQKLRILRLMDIMLDRFGHDIWIIPTDEEHFRTRALVSVSPQFFGWLTGLGGGVTIEGPANVREEYQAFVRGVLGNY